MLVGLWEELEEESESLVGAHLKGRAFKGGTWCVVKMDGEERVRLQLRLGNQGNNRERKQQG